MRTFRSGQEAKKYLVAQIVFEAARSGTALSDTERKMMYFNEIAWTLPDMVEVNEAFERDYDQPAYEAKIGKLAHEAKKHAKRADQIGVWKEAVRILKREDHYLLVLLAEPTPTSDSLLVDRLKLVGAALLICLLLVVAIFLFSSNK